MAELLLTVPEAAARLRLSPLTIQRQLKRGELRGFKRGKVWRIPETSLTEPTPQVIAPKEAAKDSPEECAAAILAAMKSGDTRRRNAALVSLYYADDDTREIVLKASRQADAEWEETEGNAEGDET